MLKYVFGMIGLVCLSGSMALGQTACAPCQAGGCGESCCQENGRCPHCGCKLVPVCHCTCEMKKETKYKYCCTCDTICVPGPGCLFGKCCGGDCGEGCCEKGCCEKGCCESCEKGCCETCNSKNSGCGCSVHCVKKLIKCPYTVEHPVRKCTVEWCCPNCSGCGGGQCGCAANVVTPMAPAPGGAAPTVAPAPKAPQAPIPAPPKATMNRGGLLQSLFAKDEAN